MIIIEINPQLIIHVPSSEVSQCLAGRIERFDHRHSLASYFEMHCSSGSPSQIAAIHNDSFITFQHLNSQANIVARNILKSFNPDQNQNYFFAGILLDEGFQRLTAILACLKLGLVIVPLATDHHPEQLNQISKRCNLSILIHNHCPIVNLTIPNNRDVAVLLMDNLLDNSDRHSSSNMNLNEHVTPQARDNPVVVLNTSGSSGTPKIITLTNSQLFNRLFWQWRYLPYKTKEVVCHRTNFMFVDNIIECLSCLLSSVTMVIVAPLESCDIVRLSEIIEKHKVSWLLTVPSLLQKWMNQMDGIPKITESLATLSTVVSSGEMLFPRVAKRFFKTFLLDKCQLVNLYGSTEVCGDVSCQALFSVEDVNYYSRNEFLSVGYPISNNQIFVNSNGHNGGDVIVVGENVSPTCGRAFPTGDMGFIHKNKLYICGRVDDMVKINGKKFFTKDITLAVMFHPEVDSCYTVHLVAKGKSHIVSFFSVKNQNSNKTIIKREISNMLLKNPSGFSLPRLEWLETIPTQSQSMKPDKKLLSSIASKLLLEELGVQTKPSTVNMSWKFPGNLRLPSFPRVISDESFSHRKFILEILSKHLGRFVDDLNESMSFYDIGGDSLTIVICVADLNRKGFCCTSEAFFYNYTIGDIVDCILQQSNSAVQRVSDIQLLKYVHSNFLIENIEYEQKNEIIEFLIANFYPKELVVRHLNVSVNVFINVVSQIFDMAVRSRCSFCIRDVISKTIVGVQLSEDSSYDFVDEGLYVRLDGDNALECFLQYCKPSMAQFLKNPKLNVAVVSLSSSLKTSTVIQLLYFIEKHTIDLARRHGFHTIETINTSEATKKLCSELNYRLIQSTSLDNFLNDFQPHPSHLFTFPNVFGHYMILDLGQ